MGKCLLGLQYPKSDNKLPEASFMSKTDNPSLMNTIYNVFKATNKCRDTSNSSKTQLHHPSCKSKRDLPPIRFVPNPSYFSGIISNAMERKSALSHCKILSASTLSNCVGIMEALEETMEQSISMCPDKKGFLLKSDFRLDSAEVNFMTPECYEEIISCSSTKMTSVKQSTLDCQKNQDTPECEILNQKKSASETPTNTKISTSKVTAEDVDMAEKSLTSACAADVKCSASEVTPSGHQKSCTSETPTPPQQCSNEALHTPQPSHNEFTIPRDDPDFNSNCEVLRGLCDSIPDGFWDSDSDDEVFTDSCDEDTSSVCSSDSFCYHDNDAYTSSDDEDDELCAWDRIVNTRTPYTTHRKKNLLTSRRRRFSGDSNCGSRRCSGKADSSYKRFENRESAEFLLNPCDDFESGEEDEASWFSVVEAESCSAGETTPIIVRPYCVNSTISSIIGWHDDDDNADSDDDESDHESSSFWDDSDFTSIPTCSNIHQGASTDAAQQERQSKVRFCDTVEVHHMIAWSYAYREARKGKWEQEARDRERFRHRIINTDNCISWVLNKSHRDTIYRKLHEN